MAVLIGFAGLALDGGRLYVNKTELQNAADACALAASYELTGTPIAGAAYTRAVNAGLKITTENRVDFQGPSIAAADTTVEFGTSLAAGSGWVSAGGATGVEKYVRCTIARGGILPWFMQVLGFGAQTVSALATATLAPAQSNCAIPMGLCTAGGAAPDFGRVVGQWYSMNFADKNDKDAENLTGNFRWLDFDPGAPTPGCPGGGASELACVLKGSGACNLPPEGPATCPSSGSSSAPPGCVGQTGSISSLEAAFNTRFGIYKNNADAATAPPDFTGFAFNVSTWPLGHDAYAGTSGTIDNFKTARTNHTPAQSTYAGGGYSVSTVQTHTTSGADRRLVTVPFVDCGSFAGGQHAPVRGYACILLTEPYKKVGNDVTVTAEYLGRSNVAGSPCATSGAVGSTTSVGPLVPALVQ